MWTDPEFGKEGSRVVALEGFVLSIFQIPACFERGDNKQGSHLLEVDGNNAGAGEALWPAVTCESVVRNTLEFRGQVVAERVRPLVSEVEGAIITANADEPPI